MSISTSILATTIQADFESITSGPRDEFYFRLALDTARDYDTSEYDLWSTIVENGLTTRDYDGYFLPFSYGDDLSPYVSDRRADTFDYCADLLHTFVSSMPFDPDVLQACINRTVDGDPIDNRFISRKASRPTSMASPAECTAILLMYLYDRTSGDEWVDDLLSISKPYYPQDHSDADHLRYKRDPIFEHMVDPHDDHYTGAIASMGGMSAASDATNAQPVWGNTSLPWSVMRAIIDRQAVNKLTGGYNISVSNLCVDCRTYKSASGSCFC